MIVEAFKLVTSILPFVKEAFLWRDGAQIGKPITKKNLIRRKIAVFVLLASLVVNYLLIDHFYKDYIKIKELEKHVTELEIENKTLDDENKDLLKKQRLCLTIDELAGFCERQIKKFTKK